MPTRLSLSEGSLFPVQAFFNAVPDFRFRFVVTQLLNGIGHGCDYAHCTFPDDLDPGEESFAGVRFSLFEESVIVSKAELKKYVRQACAAYLVTNPEERDALNRLLADSLTESEWLEATDPEPMLDFLQSKASDRKLRLLTAGACQQIWHLVPNRCRIASGALELYADGLISKEKYQEAWGEADIECRMCAQDPPNATTYAAESVMISSPPTTSSVKYALSTAAIACGCSAAENAAESDYDSVVESNQLRAAGEQARLCRCVFGNPFRSSTVQSSWLASTVFALATGIYDERAFDRMPILADALQDAGCDNDDILNHCRQPGKHVCGCWVVDLLLGKT